ncbi:hypothetical protein [Phenylobacterium sp.]|uniref:hypothetical protein n=1 Tax=Phenylobacterium sp. TaxID=1871053 RepID=UPI002DE836D9|nr:hypothetical protein [Phenylobacterium sp.]
MFPKSATLLAPMAVMAAALALAGCGRTPPRRTDAPSSAAGSDYAAPPSVDLVRNEAAGPRLSGTAPPGVQVRLGSPAGVAVSAWSDTAGHWTLRLAPAAGPRIFGLSETLGGRQAQAQGYVLLTPQGPAALLRAGAGAIRLDPRRGPGLGAIDFDAEGGAVVSGVAPADTPVFVRLDGRQAAQARADGQGRYAIALSQPIPGGTHTVEVNGDNFEAAAKVAVTPAEPLVAGPLRSQFTKGGLRIDWRTPGGGVQSTLLLD